MTLAATDFNFRQDHAGVPASKGPQVDRTHWGYAVHERTEHGVIRLFGAAASRFVGTVLLLIAAGLLIIPDAAHGEGVAALKLAAMVLFTGVGLFLYFFGRDASHPEFHVDISRGEIRIGRRGMTGKFRRNSTLAFEQVASVYLLRTKDRSRPTRLFLRLAGNENAIEVACGPEAELEALRGTLSRDLAGDPHKPVAAQLSRHARLAA